MGRGGLAGVGEPASQRPDRPQRTLPDHRHAGFGHLERDPQAAEVFNQAMVDLTRLAALDIARAYDFSDRR